MDKIELAGILDLKVLQSIMDDFYAITGIANGLIDLEGKVLVGCGWQKICTKFHRQNSETLKNCFESDLILTKGVKKGEFQAYRCKNGLYDVVTPLVIGDTHVANIFSGQFFFEDSEIDYGKFVNQAEKYGFDKTEYISALNQVPRVNRQRTQQIMAYLTNLTEMISQQGLNNLKLSKSLLDQKRVEEALREGEERLKRSQKIAHLGSWELDLVGSKLTWSDEVYRIFGLQPQEFGASYDAFLSYVHPDDRVAVDQAYSSSLKTGKDGYEIEHRIQRKDNGEIRFVHEKCSHIRNKSGQIIRSIGMVHDITERKKAEEALEYHAEELEKTRIRLEEKTVLLEKYANQMEELAEKRAEQLKDAERLAAIGATAGMVGHDIRNPLQAIVSDVFLAKTELAQFGQEDQIKYALESLDEIEKNTEYINKIVQDLQDYARPLNPKPEESDLKEIISNILSNSGAEKIKTTVEITDEARKIFVDSHYLNRILYNLINNALQAMPNGGELTLQIFKETNSIVIRVKDTGVGIPKEVQDKIFTVMFTTKSKGQGFGLPVVKRMTEALGGTVFFESQVGKGTAFTICLPIRSLST